MGARRASLTAVAAVPAGATSGEWLVVLVLVTSLVFAVFPDSSAGAGALALTGVWLAGLVAALTGLLAANMLLTRRSG